jgi:hypothetical protein
MENRTWRPHRRRRFSLAISSVRRGVCTATGHFAWSPSSHEQLRDAGPVFKLKKYGIYGMARYAQVQGALNDWQTFISGAGAGIERGAGECSNGSAGVLFRPQSADAR